MVKILKYKIKYKEKEQNGVEILKYIGRIDKNKLGEYAKNLITDKVIVTDERIMHIKERHKELENREIKYMKEILKDPDIIFKDKKNKDTILMVKGIIDNGRNYKMVIKLNTTVKNKFNSIISFWKIDNKKVRQHIRNEEIIYKKLDINE